MKELPLNALRAFALTVTSGGVRAAARELGVSHSAVSRRLLELEKWLGRSLFERASGHGGFTATSQGRRLAAQVTKALRDMGLATQAVREPRSRFAVTIGAAPSLANRWLIPRLPHIQKAYPRLEVSVLADQRPLDPRDSGCDLSIRMGPGPWADVEATPLMGDALYPVMSEALWRKAGRPASPAQLKGLRLLHDRDPSAGWAAWRSAFGPEDLDIRQGPRFDSSDLVLRAAAHGLGVALARDRLVEADLSSGTLVRPFKGLAVPLENAYWVITLPAEKRAGTSALIAWLKREGTKASARLSSA